MTLNVRIKHALVTLNVQVTLSYANFFKYVFGQTEIKW